MPPAEYGHFPEPTTENPGSLVIAIITNSSAVYSLSINGVELLQLKTRLLSQNETRFSN